MCVTCTYLAIKFMGENAVIVLVLWGALLAKPTMECLIWVYRGFRDAPLKPYQGSYYAFDGKQVRVFEFSQALWVVDIDILAIVSMAYSESSRKLARPSEYRYLESQKLWVYSEQAALRLVQNSRHFNAHRLQFWLLREVYFPYSRR